MTELRALAEKSFGSWQRGTPARPTLSTPTSIPPRVVIVDKPGSPQTQLRVATIGAARSSPDFRPMQVMNLALGGQFLQPHQHEPARGSTATPTARRRSSPSVAPPGRSRSVLACGPT